MMSATFLRRAAEAAAVQAPAEAIEIVGDAAANLAADAIVAVVQYMPKPGGVGIQLGLAWDVKKDFENEGVLVEDGYDVLNKHIFDVVYYPPEIAFEVRASMYYPFWGVAKGPSLFFLALPIVGRVQMGVGNSEIIDYYLTYAPYSYEDPDGDKAKDESDISFGFGIVSGLYAEYRMTPKLGLSLGLNLEFTGGYNNAINKSIVGFNPELMLIFCESSYLFINNMFNKDNIMIGFGIGKASIYDMN